MDAPPTDARPIWAPWRLEYILAPRDGECFICDKAEESAEDLTDHDLANRVIARGESAYVLLNTYPYNPGHLLVAPYRHLATLGELSADERAEIMGLMATCEEVLQATMQPDGFNFGCNQGGAAGAGLKDHLHWHVVPRWNGDTNFMPVIGQTGCVPQAMDDTCHLLRKHWP